MSRWLAGVFDPGARFPDSSRLAEALAPHPAHIVEDGPLRLAYSGPASRTMGPLCLLDGVLDNLAELRAELTDKTDRTLEREIRATSREAAAAGDLPAEELLQAGYRRWGRDLLPRLRGDFVLLIWDRDREVALLARDQLGVRPCFIRHDGRRLWFASEMRCLLSLLPQRPAPDSASVAHWVAVSNRPGMATLYQGISRLRPGGLLTLDRHGIREEPYWSPVFEGPLNLPDDRLAEVMREALGRAVGRRLDPAGLTGVTMSGGLDSSSVAALCAEQAPGMVLACSAAFPEHPAADESDLIEELRTTLELPGLSADVRPGGLIASALESLAAWQLPLRSWGDFWALPLLRSAARAGVGTVLGGDGGDELFGARSYLLADRMRSGQLRDALALTLQLPGAGNRPPRREVVNVFASLALMGSLPYRLDALLQRSSQARSAPSWLWPRALKELVDSDDPAAWKRLPGPRWWAHAAHGITRGIEEGGVFEHHRRRAALAGVESRHPLLDLDLVTLALRQAPRSTLDPHRTRPLLRASMAGLLPDVVRLRPAKAQFESVIVDCLRGPDLATMRRLLSDPGAELGAYVDLDGVRHSLLEGHRALRPSPFAWMWRVWRLVTAECWLRSQARPISETSALAERVSAPRITIRATEPSYVFPP